jgi:branched-chain amino acid transport system permease protein
MVILLLGIVLGGRKSLWGAFVGASLIILLPNLLSNRTLFQAFTATGLLLALLAGWRGLSRKSTRPFQAVAPIIAMGMLAVGGFLVENTEDWRKAIFALMLFSVVVGLPEGIMGFVILFMERLFRIDPPALPAPLPLDEVLGAREADGSPLLVLRDVSRHFGGIRAVDGISLTVRSGQVHGLIGPNGSGKSTLVNVISGLYSPTGGELFLHDRKLASGSLFKVARQGIARTFQNLQLFGEMSALDNVMVAMKDRYRSWLPLVLLGLAGRDERRAKAAALTMLEMVGLADQARIPAKDLPYGAQRLLEIARALGRRPEILILDEPAAGLAHPDVLLLVEIIRRIHQRGITIILIEHHMEVVSGLCDIVTVLDGGRVIAEGTAEEIRRNPQVIKAYLGSSREVDTPPGSADLNAEPLTV